MPEAERCGILWSYAGYTVHSSNPLGDPMNSSPTATPTPDVPIERLFAVDWWVWKARESRVSERMSA